MGLVAYSAMGIAMAAVMKACAWVVGRRRGRRGRHMDTVKGRHVVITGGSSGIGLAIARRCAAEGAFVTLIARTPSKLAHAHHLLTSSLNLPPDSILIKAVDVTNAEATACAIKESFEWRPIDVLVCCAGYATGGLLDHMKVNTLDFIARTNLLGCIFPIHAVLPLMKTRSLQHPSSIVIMSSLSALMALYGSNMYTPTKYALKGLAEMLRFELLPWNIRVNLVCPGFTETPMLTEVERCAYLVELTQKLYGARREDIELPEEVARVTIEGLKKGDFLVSTTFKGFLAGILGRGCVPAESFVVFVIELMLIVPLRVLSFLWLRHAERILRKEPIREKPDW